MPLTRNNQALQGLQGMDFNTAADLGEQESIERGGLPAVGTMNPLWSRYFGGLTHLAGGREQKFVGGPSAPGSNQMRGISPPPVNPALDTLSTDDLIEQSANSRRQSQAAIRGIQGLK